VDSAASTVPRADDHGLPQLPPGQEKVYRELFWTLHRAAGRTLADIENLEVSS
jgi:hypothetical protein